MLLQLTFDHSALKTEAKDRGYKEPRFTESLYCQVSGYEKREAYPGEPWAVSGFSRFVYCDEAVTVNFAAMDGKRLYVYHDCDQYPCSPIVVTVQSAVKRDAYPVMCGGKKDQNNTCKLVD